MKYLFISFWKSMAWAIIILILCLMPSSDLERVRFINIPYMDKFVHLGLYIVFTLLLISEKNPQRNSGLVSFKTLAFAVGFSLFYGILIELMQLWFTSSRSADIWDVVADSIGITIALTNYKWVNKVTGGRF